MSPAVSVATRHRWIASEGLTAGARNLPEEVPVALAYAGCSFAVMMATPSDLEDFAVGFTLSEGLADGPEDIEDVVVRPQPTGMVLDITLSAPALDRFRDRRRYLAGPAGCGLCGLDSIAEAVREVPTVPDGARIRVRDVAAAVAEMPRLQRLNASTHALHAAAFWRAGRIALLREDVGRHNALDKLAGAVWRGRLAAEAGMLLLTSRVSVDLIQKAAMLGCCVMVAVSVPTGLAVRAAAKAGITLVGVARHDGFEIFSRPERIVEHVAADMVHRHPAMAENLTK